jgi:hypothetical protein
VAAEAAVEHSEPYQQVLQLKAAAQVERLAVTIMETQEHKTQVAVAVEQVIKLHSQQAVQVVQA